MTLNLSISVRDDLRPRITVFGVGGAGSNAVDNMIRKQLEGVDFVVANTDAQALAQSSATSRIQMGASVTEGLGAGARANVGAAAAEESIEEIVDHLAGAHMCFITAGMGGGTGTGAAPIIAHAARELGVLTVGVVTKPFQFEGIKRMRQAEEGIEQLQKMVGTLIIIPNQNLFRLANEKTTFTEAFSQADDVLYQGVKGVTDLMVRPGLINLDFADVRAVMDEMGKAMMGTGEASGEDRATQAAEKAVANPLLDEISLKGARGVLINITGGKDLTLFELDEAANRIREEVDSDANIIVGSTLDTDMDGAMRVSVVATGIDATEAAGEGSVPHLDMAESPQAAKVDEDLPALRLVDEPVPATTVAEEAESILFPQFEPDAAPEQAGDIDSEKSDNLPPPAYRPKPEEPDCAPQPVHRAAENAASGTPAAPCAGTTSPETLARLEAAVQKVPPRRVEPQLNGVLNPAGSSAPRKPRFGINALIGRMTGTDTDGRHTPPPVQSPAKGYDNGSGMEAEQERLEIPAFLRRQAN